MMVPLTPGQITTIRNRGVEEDFRRKIHDRAKLFLDQYLEAEIEHDPVALLRAGLEEIERLLDKASPSGG